MGLGSAAGGAAGSGTGVDAAAGFGAGIGFGAGAAFGVGAGFSAKAEYLHIDLSHKKDRALNSAIILPIVNHDHALTEDVVRVGVNYRFGPSNTVTAKY